jgi:hypothetical protein
VTDVTLPVLAIVHHNRDERTGETYCLQIELGNGRAITLTVWEGQQPTVSVWHGNGEHSFVRTDIEPGESPESFRQFVADAFEPGGAMPKDHGTHDDRDCHAKVQRLLEEIRRDW